MTEDEILAEFRAAEALLEGHFILSSGLQQPALPAMRARADGPARAPRASPRRSPPPSPPSSAREIDIVVSPAMGGVIIGHEMGRALGVRGDLRRAADRHVRAAPRLPRSRRGRRCCWSRTSSPPACRSREAIAAVEAGRRRGDRRRRPGRPLRAAAADLGVPFFPLVRLDVPAYPADALPPELAAIPAEKPGSRKVAA